MKCINVLKRKLGAGALGRPRGMVWGGRREEGSGWGTHVYLWQIHFDIWQKKKGNSNVITIFFCHQIVKNIKMAHTQS